MVIGPRLPIVFPWQGGCSSLGPSETSLTIMTILHFKHFNTDFLPSPWLGSNQIYAHLWSLIDPSRFQEVLQDPIPPEISLDGLVEDWYG